MIVYELTCNSISITDPPPIGLFNFDLTSPAMVVTVNAFTEANSCGSFDYSLQLEKDTGGGYNIIGA